MTAALREHVFISYASEDREAAYELNERLKLFQFTTWVDYERLVPGQLWARTIQEAIKASRAVVFLSSKHSIHKTGYVQREIKEILNKVAESPTGDIVVIVARLDETVPRDEELTARQWVDVFTAKDVAFKAIIQGLLKNASEEYSRREQLALSIDVAAERDRSASEQPPVEKTPDAISPIPGASGVLFQPEELDIYCNKVTKDAYIFHGKEIDYARIRHLEYDGDEYLVAVVLTDGTVLDLGVRIQWLVRPYWENASEVNIVRTKDGKSLDGCVVPLLTRGNCRWREREQNLSRNASHLRRNFFDKWLRRFRQ